MVGAATKDAMKRAREENTIDASYLESLKRRAATRAVEEDKPDACYSHAKEKTPQRGQGA
jgi:hypothetical protein